MQRRLSAVTAALTVLLALQAGTAVSPNYFTLCPFVPWLAICSI